MRAVGSEERRREVQRAVVGESANARLCVPFVRPRIGPSSARLGGLNYVGVDSQQPDRPGVWSGN